MCRSNGAWFTPRGCSVVIYLRILFSVYTLCSYIRPLNVLRVLRTGEVHTPLQWCVIGLQRETHHGSCSSSVLLHPRILLFIQLHLYTIWIMHQFRRSMFYWGCGSSSRSPYRWPNITLTGLVKIGGDRLTRTLWHLPSERRRWWCGGDLKITVWLCMQNAKLPRELSRLWNRWLSRPVEYFTW